MWPMPTLAHKFVAIFFTPDLLTCVWIDSSARPECPAGVYRRVAVRAFKSYPLHNGELENLTLFNPTIIKKYIISFLCEHNLQDAFVAFVLHGSAVQEQFVAMPSSTPHRADFMISNSAHVMWEYRYVYQNDHGQFVFYVYSVPRSVLLQYKLLAIAAQCNLITMTTQTMALLSAYQHMFGSAFRRSQLAVDMMRCNNNISDLITVDAVRRMVNMDGLNLHALSAELLTKVGGAAGLFCSENNIL
ncbi:MAG TPA: hypothetical protein VHX42_01210 [Candidatus Babeliales bacterium]|nr:hypothetical protein [Candidatus Babeliales bacterium]